MAHARSEPVVRISSAPPSEVETDLLVIPIGSEDDAIPVAGLDAATKGELGRAWASGEFRPEVGELFLTPVTGEGWRPARVSLVGMGAADAGCWGIHKALATVAMHARVRRMTNVAVLARRPWAGAEGAQALTEGVLLGAYQDRRLKTDPSDPKAGRPLEHLTIVTDRADAAVVTPAVERAAVLAASTNVARDFANEPPNALTPVRFAERAVDRVRPHGIETTVLGEEEMRELGMGLLLGVAQGSNEAPRMLVMRYEPARASSPTVLALVGKGVTFDTGGISLKPPDGMHKMKTDMAGGAAVVGAMDAIGQLKPAVRCLGIVPLAENMPGGRATRPGDVLTAASGTTVEVLNTDAEGRLLLGDALWYARKLGATHLVDVATLTGACVVALGTAASGLFGRPASWVEAVRGAAARQGERLWPLPLFEDYREQLKSDVADLANVGGRPAGACTAAAFLQTFAGDLPWAHVDIAGTAARDETSSEAVSGATGVMVRALVELACSTGDGEGGP